MSHCDTGIILVYYRGQGHVLNFIVLMRLLKKLNLYWLHNKKDLEVFSNNSLAIWYVIIIIMYIYHALINALSAHMIHINLNMIFYTHVKHSPTKTIYIKYYLIIIIIIIIIIKNALQTRTHTHQHTH